MSRIVVIHHDDPDGWASAAIVSSFVSQVTSRLLPMAIARKVVFLEANYSAPPERFFDLVRPDDEVYVVDFNIRDRQGRCCMADMQQRCARLVWIDHHKTSVEDEKNLELGRIEGIRDVRDAACALTWEFFFGANRIPTAIQRIAAYDAWKTASPDHSWESQTCPFYYAVLGAGMRHPDDPRWVTLFASSAETEEWTIRGRAIYQFQRTQWAETARKYAGETEFEGLPAVVLEASRSSLAFDTVYNPERHRLMLSYRRLPKEGVWVVSVYTEHNDVDCSALCRKHGGGGHRKAAGFSCKTLPFSI